MTDKVSPEKIDLLKAYGAEVIVCPVDVEPDDPRSYYSTAERLSKETLILSAKSICQSNESTCALSNNRA